METTADPAVREADARAERAKHSLSERMNELGRRFRSVGKLDNVKEKIVAHPWPAVGAAFALGVIAALATGGRRSRPEGERSVGGMVFAGLGAVAIKMLKSYAVGRLADAARGWIDERANESSSSRDPSVESFLEH